MPLRTPLIAAVALATVLVGVGTPASAAGGGVSAPDGVLFPGCHSYAYSYAVSPASTPWYLETFLHGPDGERLSAGLFISDGDPPSGTSAFGICSGATERGTFRIEAQLTTTSGSTQTTESLPSATFSLGKPASASGLEVSDPRARRGDRLQFTLTSSRQAPEGWVPNDLAAVVLQRRTPAGWRRVGGGRTETNSRGVARVRLTWPGGRERYRMVTRADEEEYAGSQSATLAVRTD